MPLLDDLNAKYDAFLNKYTKGESTSSTSKYDDIEKLLRDALGVPADAAYATGEGGKRVSNFGTRYTQGNKRAAHQRVCFAFVRKDIPASQDRTSFIEDVKTSWLNTSRKFVQTTEAGAIYDCIILFLRLNNERTVEPVCFLVLKGDPLIAEVERVFPGIERVEVERTGNAPVSTTLLPGFVAPLPPGAKEISPDLIEQLHSDLKDIGLRYDKSFVRRYVASLLVKRFVILTGLSGSGKTLLALAVAKWFQEVDAQVLRVPVGSDWTNNENVLGYQNALDPKRYVRPPSGILDLLLEAESDPNRPYFLILDEMNLSHVERYFSDVLSAMESNSEPIGLHSASDPIDEVPATLRLPGNLFIVGTVNIDETTYMFSPKVLDRANVLEFRVSAAEMEAYLAAPPVVDDSKLVGRGINFAQSVVVASNQHVALSSLVPAVTADDVSPILNKDLLDVFALLAPLGAEFGFRSAREIHRFVYFHGLLTGTGWKLEQGLDAQVYQKLMPKLHGSERRLGPVLGALQTFCKGRGCSLSMEKIQRMSERLRDGFASFAE